MVGREKRRKSRDSQVYFYTRSWTSLLVVPSPWPARARLHISGGIFRPRRRSEAGSAVVCDPTPLSLQQHSFGARRVGELGSRDWPDAGLTRD